MLNKKESDFSKFTVDLNDRDICVIDKEIISTEYAPDVFAHLRDLDGYENKNV